MSKKYKPNQHEAEDDKYDNGYHDYLMERRKLKKMKNALRSRDIDELMDLDED